MQIAPLASSLSTTSSQSTSASAAASTATSGQGTANQAASHLKKAEEALARPKEFTPAPPLRPNVQDVVDIDRALIQLRTG